MQGPTVRDMGDGAVLVQKVLILRGLRVVLSINRLLLGCMKILSLCGTNDAKTKDTSSQNAANTTVTAYPWYARTATAYAKRTGLTQTRIPPEASSDHSEITDTALSENDMKRINKKIKMYEEIFAKNRQRTTQTKTTTNKNPAFYNHGQKLKKQRDRKRYTPPRIYDYRKKLKITLSLEN